MHKGRNKIIPVLSALLILAFSASADAATIRVPQDQPTIQAGIDAATMPGDIVLVSAGTYTGSDNRDLELRGIDITVRSESGAAVTIIDCEDLGRGFHIHMGETAAAVIEGFTIRRGLATDGGGMRLAGASPTVMACVITDCEADQGGGVAGEATSSEFVDCTFSENQAFNFGGGLLFRQSSPTLLRCEVRLNQLAFGQGGGLRAEDCPLVTVEDCLFTGNRAGSQGTSGGGLAVGGALRMIRSELRDNHANTGGGMSVGGPATLTECAFFDNVGFGEIGVTGMGGAVHCWGELQLDESTFVGNSSEVGGAIHVIGTVPLTFSGCVFFRNEARGMMGGGSGGAIAGSGALNLVGCTLVENFADEGGGVAHGSPGNPGDLTVDNAIIAFSAGGSAIHCNASTSATLVCTDVYGNAGGDWVGCIAGQAGMMGNIEADPLFCDRPNGDLTIDGESPCAEAPGCGLIGALPVGCGMTPLEPTTWGAIKARMGDR